MNIQTDNTNRQAVTLVELLVAMAILTILTAIIVPRVRTVNKDRNVREATRVVGSAFAKASQRAVTDGSAGILIRRNPNFLGYVDLNQNGLQDAATEPSNVYYAGTSITFLRKVPDYTDDYGMQATIQGSSTHSGVFVPSGQRIAKIRLPVDHDPANGQFVIQPRDKFFIGSRPTPYTIERVMVIRETNTVTSEQIDYLELLLETWTPSSRAAMLPPANGSYPYRIERMPREAKTTQFDLPAGHFVDLRHSGSFLAGITVNDSNSARTMDTATYPDYFRMAMTRPTLEDGSGNRFASEDVRVIFNREGEIDRIHYGDGIDPDAQPVPTLVDSVTRGAVTFNIQVLGPALLNSESYISTSALQLLVTEDGLDLPPSEDTLSQPNSLWVIVNPNGSTNISSNIPTPLRPGADAQSNIQERVNLARGIGRRREAATQ